MNGNGNDNGNGNGQTIGWPAAMVAMTIILLLGTITVTAILKYPSPDDALKIWAALSGVAGLITGAFVTYFFTQGTVQEAKAARNVVLEQAEKAEARASDFAEKAEARAEALAATAGKLGTQEWRDLVDRDPAVRRALGM